MNADEEIVTDMEQPPFGNDLMAITIGDRTRVYLKSPIVRDGKEVWCVEGRVRLFSPSLYLETDDGRLLSMQRDNVVAFERPAGPRTEEEMAVIREYLRVARETAKVLQTLAVYVEGAMVRIVRVQGNSEEKGMYA